MESQLLSNIMYILKSTNISIVNNQIIKNNSIIYTLPTSNNIPSRNTIIQ